MSRSHARTVRRAPAGRARFALVVAVPLALAASAYAAAASAPPRPAAAPAAAAAAAPKPASAPRATARPAPAAPAKVTTVEGITEYRLANGLKVLLFPDPSKPTITVNVTYLVGSRHEGYGESGMAHLLEHLLFKGTPRFPNIPQELTARGARPNGTTSYDRTNYFETFAATDDNLRWALDLESDRMVNSFVAAKDLQSEFSVVRNEFESGENDPSRVLLQRVMAAAYLWHNYGNAVIGSREDIERVPIDRLQAFYRKYYQPDNAVLTIAGRVDEAKTIALVNDTFGRIPKPARVLQQTYTVEPVQDGERQVTLRRVGDVQVAAAGYHVPSGSHPDFAAVQVLVDVLTNEPAGRLYKALVETGKASGVYGLAFALKDPGYAYFGAEVLKDKPLAAASEAMLATLDGLKEAPVSKDEVERAKNRYLKFFEQTYNDSGRVGLVLSDYIGKGDWRLWFLYRDAMEKVTADDVNRVAAAYLKPANRTAGRFVPDAAPDRAVIPAAPEPGQLLAGYQGRAALQQAEVFDASPANIDARTRSETLPGGARYSFLAKSTRGNAVEATITLRIASEAALQDRGTVAQLTAEMLRRGTKSRSLQQINDQLDALKSSVSISGSGQTVGIRVVSTRDNLGPALEIVTDLLRAPAFPEAEFGRLRDEVLAGIDQQRSDPGAIAQQELDRILSPWPRGHFRYVENFDEQVAAVKAATVEELRRFHAEFYGAAAATAAVVGDFDPVTTRAALGAMLAGWAAPQPFQRAPDRYFEVPAVTRRIDTPDKANATLLAGVNLALRDDDPDYPALVLANYMLGGGFLNSRLATRIRQKEGISYGVQSILQADPLDKVGGFLTFAIYNPENSARLLAAWREELAKMLREGFTEAEFRDARDGWLLGRGVSRSQDRELVGKLASYLYLGRTMDWDAQLEKRVAAMTVADVNAAVRRWIDPAKITVVEAGAFSTPLRPVVPPP
ncbi:MAG: insulinase family protein [Steroidobacteraceae bacterium]|nr:insulinase family protein [Steroidobacteraceae bacterium]